MSGLTREVSWGDGLVVAAFKSPGGMKGAVEAIIYEVGRHIGTRNTFSKLLKVADPASLGERDLFRAWLLLVAFEQEPNEWGVDDSVVPRSIDVETLKERIRESVRHQGLEPRTRWLGASSTVLALPRRPAPTSSDLALTG